MIISAALDILIAGSKLAFEKSAQEFGKGLGASVLRQAIAKISSFMHNKSSEEVEESLRNDKKTSLLAIMEGSGIENDEELIVLLETLKKEIEKHAPNKPAYAISNVQLRSKSSINLTQIDGGIEHTNIESEGPIDISNISSPGK